MFCYHSFTALGQKDGPCWATPWGGVDRCVDIMFLWGSEYNYKKVSKYPDTSQIFNNICQRQKLPCQISRMCVCLCVILKPSQLLFTSVSPIRCKADKNKIGRGWSAPARAIITRAAVHEYQSIPLQCLVCSVATSTSVLLSAANCWCSSSKAFLWKHWKKWRSLFTSQTVPHMSHSTQDLKPCLNTPLAGIVYNWGLDQNHIRKF